MIKVSVTTDNRIFDEASDRENLMWFYSQVEELIEAAYLLSIHKSKKKSKRKSRNCMSSKQSWIFVRECLLI
jgi:hypothetical protein